MPYRIAEPAQAMRPIPRGSRNQIVLLEHDESVEHFLARLDSGALDGPPGQRVENPCTVQNYGLAGAHAIDGVQAPQVIDETKIVRGVLGNCRLEAIAEIVQE